MELFYFNKEKSNTIIECGIDEAGRGPLIGNVYAAVVIWPIDLIPDEDLIKDSKKLSQKKKKKSIRMD
jgi:ribonuclease HII